MNKYRKLLGNSLIFAIGNLGSKLIVVFLLPIYTRYLTTGEYGAVDLLTTTTNMLAPIISLSIYDAVLRYVLDKKYVDVTLLSNGVIVTLIGIAIAAIFTFFNIPNVGYLWIILSLQSFQTLFSQYARGVGKVKLYAVNGIVQTLVTCVAAIILLVYFRLGLVGYFWAVIIANLFSVIFLFVTLHLADKIKMNKFDFSLLKKMLYYSIPLIPNSFAWWLSNASSRYFILYFLSIQINGLFAVANKIPSLLSMLNTIFFQSWQLSAIEEYEDRNDETFYSKVFAYYSQLLFLATSVLLLCLKPILRIAVASEFYTSWLYVPPLLFANIYSSFSSFLGTSYIAAEKTTGVLFTTAIGAILNVVLNFVFIPSFGGIGAGLASMLSFLLIWLIRQKDTQKLIHLTIDLRNMAFNHLVLFLQCGIIYAKSSLKIEFLLQLVVFLVACLINRELIKSVIKAIDSNVVIKISNKK